MTTSVHSFSLEDPDQVTFSDRYITLYASLKPDQTPHPSIIRKHWLNCAEEIMDRAGEFYTLCVEGFDGEDIIPGVTFCTAECE